MTGIYCLVVSALLAFSVIGNLYLYNEVKDLKLFAKYDKKGIEIRDSQLEQWKSYVEFYKEMVDNYKSMYKLQKKESDVAREMTEVKELINDITKN